MRDELATVAREGPDGLADGAAMALCAVLVRREDEPPCGAVVAVERGGRGWLVPVEPLPPLLGEPGISIPLFRLCYIGYGVPHQSVAEVLKPEGTEPPASALSRGETGSPSSFSVSRVC